MTSGTQSPTLGTNIGLALIDTAYTEIGQEVEVGIRNKKIKAKIVPTPFINAQSKKEEVIWQNIVIYQ